MLHPLLPALSLALLVFGLLLSFKAFPWWSTLAAIALVIWVVWMTARDGGPAAASLTGLTGAAVLWRFERNRRQRLAALRERDAREGGISGVRIASGSYGSGVPGWPMDSRVELWWEDPEFILRCASAPAPFVRIPAAALQDVRIGTATPRPARGTPVTMVVGRPHGAYFVVLTLDQSPEVVNTMRSAMIRTAEQARRGPLDGSAGFGLTSPR